MGPSGACAPQRPWPAPTPTLSLWLQSRGSAEAASQGELQRLHSAETLVFYLLSLRSRGCRMAAGEDMASSRPKQLPNLLEGSRSGPTLPCARPSEFRSRKLVKIKGKRQEKGRLSIRGHLERGPQPRLSLDRARLGWERGRGDLSRAVRGPLETTRQQRGAVARSPVVQSGPLTVIVSAVDFSVSTGP